MGIKKKKLRARAQMDYIRFMSHAEKSLDAAMQMALESASLKMKIGALTANLADKEQIIEKLRNRSGAFPTIISHRSFMDGISKIPVLEPISGHPHIGTFEIPVSNKPQGLEHRPSYHPSDSDFLKMKLEIARVMDPEIHHKPFYGYKIPAGVVLVDLDPRETRL